MISGREAILQDVVRACDGMGAHFSWKGTQRWRTWPPDGGYPAASVIDEEETVTEDNIALTTRLLRYSVVGWYQCEFGQDDGPATAANEMIADIEAAVLADRRRSENAIDTKLLGSETFVVQTGAPNVMVSVRFETLYRTTLTDPHDTR